MSTSPIGNVVDVKDSSRTRISAASLLGFQNSWRQESKISRLAKQLLDQNEGLLQDFDVQGEVVYYGDSVNLALETGSITGALPLRSPTTGRADYGLLIRPRFGWQGVGRTLLHSGWRVTPDLLQLPKLPQSDRRIPPWVLASTVLRRLEDLLDNLTREFQLTEENRRRPRGRVQWQTYLDQHVARGRFLEVPCRFPELQDDHVLRGAIKYTLQKQRNSLEAQREAGPMVVRLIEKCRRLLQRVQGAPTRQPDSTTLRQRGTYSPTHREVFERGLEAIEWTVEERGLAGLGDLSGLPWRLPMSSFFEAWVETIAERYCTLRGGSLRTGRDHETVVPLSWEPPYLGSQASLRPDFIIDRGPQSIVLDAKYKSHWEELNLEAWQGAPQALREQHRADLLQVLAYANLADAPHITACLISPCRTSTWESLGDRDRRAHKLNSVLATKLLNWF